MTGNFHLDLILVFFAAVILLAKVHTLVAQCEIIEDLDQQ